MGPEDRAREQIDGQLEAAGWKVQDRLEMDLGAGPGIAVREFTLATGEADYLLFVDRKACGVIEAKPEGTTLSGVADQTGRYQAGAPDILPTHEHGLRFAYESTGAETFFRDQRDNTVRSRRVFSFHRPETLREWLAQPDTLRTRLSAMPPLITPGLRGCQVEAITNLEKSFADARPRALIQMASGGGKTFTAVTFSYRLIKHADARRVLFLVDRNNLGRQTRREFQQYVTPDDGRRFTDLYNVQHLTSNTFDPVSRVCVTTIQRLYSMLRGDPDLDPELEEKSMFDTAARDERPKDVAYNPRLPIETFDFVITDECHRSIYHLWRQVLEYFDAFIIGLTATPSKQTLGFFNQNLVMEYNHERAVADGVNVGYDVYRIKTEITDKGGKVDAGFFVDRRDKLTRKTRWEQLDDDLVYEARALDRSVVAPDQIRTIIRTFKEKLGAELFPGRTEVPKTLIFAKDDSHAEDIVHIVREEFGQGNDFCKKITYRTTGEKPEDLIASFRNSYNPRIAVTVDMISTGTDIRPLECLIFMRDTRSSLYFDQMKGRGMRTVSPDELQAVTPDAVSKTRFVIVDAVGVFESDKTQTRSLERKRTVPFDKLLDEVALGNRDEDRLSSLAGRLAQLDRELLPKDREELTRLARGKPLSAIVNALLDAIDPDAQAAKAREEFATEEPTEEQKAAARQAIAREACLVFDSAKLRNALVETKRRNEQVIDNVTKDTVLFAGSAREVEDRARKAVESFRQFIKDNKDELTALQVIYSKPYGKRHLTYEAIKELAEAIQKPPVNLTPELVWQAYERLDRARVHRAGPQKLLTNVISLVRFAIGEVDALEPFDEVVNRRFAEWISQQARANRHFSPEQMNWLTMLKDHIATSLEVGVDDLELAPFHEKGGPVKAYETFGTDLNKLLEELNEVLAA
jgi:type I restriction enzyme R subunit